MNYLCPEMMIRRFIALCLMGFLLTLTVKPTVKILSFYQNQAEIIAKHCVNKDKPELNCKGHCYLKTQLKSNDSPEDTAMPEVSIFIPMAFTSQKIIALETPVYLTKRAKYFSRNLQVSTYAAEIFTPPKLIS